MIGKKFSELQPLLKLENPPQSARLFPNGKSKLEEETTTCSIFLAALVGIKELQETLLLSLNNSEASRITNQSAQLHAFTEIQTEDGRPDGLLVVTTGKRDKIISWAAYVEVKTKATLEEEQVSRYLDQAKKDGVSAVITITNDFVTTTNINPTGVVNNKLFHWSWKSILSELRALSNNDAIADEDQVYLANELIMYLSGHKDIKDFNDMGKSWAEDAEHIVNDTKMPIKEKRELASRIVNAWVREEADIAIKLCDNELESGYHKITLDLKKEELQKDTAHGARLSEQLLNESLLRSTYIVPSLDAKVFAKASQRKMYVDLQFRGRKLCISMNVPAEDGKKAQGQTTSFLKRLSDSGIEDEIKIYAKYSYKQSDPATLKTLQAEMKDQYNYAYSTVPDELKADSIKHFVVYNEIDLAGNFYRNKKVIEMIEDYVITFYESVISSFIK
jgi:hypothetical protein